MTTTEGFKVEKIEKSQIESVDFDNLGFGTHVTDHMFMAEYKMGVWQAASIVPFQNFVLAPTTLALHYGQTVFEGLKAFRRLDGRISIFRIDKHFQRFNRSLERLCMPQVSFGLFSEAIKQLVATDSAWVPGGEGSSLYIRPFMFATEERFGVKVSEEYKFVVFAGPVGPYYSSPLRVKIEDKFIRAAKGGTGYAKCGGNYGAAFYPAHQAKLQGFDQVIWTDGSSDLYIEESGTMNVIFVIDGVVTTPPLSDTILDGITRDSFLSLAIDLGYQVKERRISALELIEAHSKGTLQEAFGVGTAAVTAAIKTIHILGKDYNIPESNSNSFSQKAKKNLLEIRKGAILDKYNWNTIVC
jgi:branched-chain amino acid aminotransferase